MSKTTKRILVFVSILLFALIFTSTYVNASTDTINYKISCAYEVENNVEQKEMPREHFIETEHTLKSDNSEPPMAEEPPVEVEPEVQVPEKEEPKVEEPPVEVEPEVQMPEMEEPNIEELPIVPEVHVHTFDDWKVVLEATCISRGQKARRCTVCGEEEIVDYVDFNAHKKVSIGDVEATCEQFGRENCQKCVICGQEFFSYAKPLGHIWSDEYTVDQEATCTRDGFMSHHCTREGCSSIKDKLVIEAKGHNLVDVEVVGTCTVKGTITKICTDCGYKGKTIITSLPEGHKYSEYVSDGNATCTHDGTKTATCTVCGDIHTVQDVGSKKEHNFELLDDCVYATCETPGRESSQRCTICGEVIKGKITEALGHEFVLMSVMVAEDPAAEQTVKCIRCHIDCSDRDHIKFGTGHQWDSEGNRCLCGDENCKGLWWDLWAKGNQENEYKDRSACIWWVGFTCNMSQCSGFEEHLSSGMKDTVIEGRRGDIEAITKQAPEARYGYVFDGWYEITADGKGKKVESTKSENGTYANGDTITVGWRDMDKGFEARYRKIK